jgi:hypothetical protein
MPAPCARPRKRIRFCEQAHACTGRWPRSPCLSPAALGGGIAQRPGAATNRLRSRRRAGSQQESGRGSAARGRGSYHSTCEAIEALANSGRNQRTRMVSQLSRTRARVHAGAAHQPVRLWILPSERGASRAAGALLTLWVRRQRQYDGLARRLRGSVTIDRRSFIRAAVSAFAFAPRYLNRKACTNSSFGGSPADAASAAIR